MSIKSKDQFLKKSDVNILNYEISDMRDNNGKETIEVILYIGESLYEYKLSLSKDHLKFLLSEIEYVEENGVDYINNED